MLDLDNRDNTDWAVSAEIQLIAPDGTTAHEFPAQTVTIGSGRSTQLNFSASLTGLKLWTAETPNLYSVIVALKDAKGHEIEAFSTKYGFRHIEQVGKFVHINGKKVFFKGTNRHDTHPLYGRAVDTGTMLKDVLMFKQNNINTLRTSHYPNPAKMYAMFDHFGIYVMNEADLECHAHTALSSDRSWAQAFVDREQRMVLRDRNHPAVIFWSLGNESACGVNFKDCYDAVRALDDRMIHYEGMQQWTYTDMTSFMYPSYSQVVGFDSNNDSRPHFLCEYAHAMGQAIGNLSDYWEYIESSKRTIGGCIWDWVDQAIYHPEEIKSGNIKGYYTGYDFPGPHQGNFVANGIVGPMREPTAKLQEVKHVYQYIKMKEFAPESKSLTVKNTYDFIDLSRFNILWSVSRDGENVENGTITDFNLGSERSTTLTIPYRSVPSGDDDSEYLLTVRFVTKNNCDWADAGHEVASDQFTIQDRSPLPTIEAPEGELTVSGNNPVTINGQGFCVKFDKTGKMQSMKFNGEDYIFNGSGPAFDNLRWIENDAPLSGIPPSTMTNPTFKPAGITLNYIDGDANGAKAVKITGRYNAHGFCAYTTSYTIYANGTIDLTATFNPATNAIDRLGLSMSVAPGLEQVQYFARGPWANYVDRKTGSHAALYTTTVTDMYEHFIRPQSMGNREDLRYLRLTNDDGFGLLIETEGRVNFSALHNTELDFIALSHDFELKHRPETILHFDYMQRGLGNGSCGPGTLDKYKVPSSGEYSYKLRFTPLVTPGAGYSVPTGEKSDIFLTSLTTEKTISDADYTATSAPEHLYTLLTDLNIIAPHSSSASIITATLSASSRSALWVDFDRDFTFKDNEKLPKNGANTWLLSVPDGITSGTYRARLSLDSAAEPTADGPLANGRVYDFFITVGQPVAITDYDTPDGNMHKDGQAYVKRIYTTGAYTDIEYITDKQPSDFYTLLNEKPDVAAGGSIILHLEANDLGKDGKIHQDLRYNYAVIYLDAYGKETFRKSADTANS
jgi:beta-galactosidase